MAAYILRRIASLIPVLFGVSVIVFASLHLTPGDPLTALLGDVPVSQETRDRLQIVYGFDRPLYEQYLGFAFRAIQGDLGYSFRFNRPVVEMIATALPSTVQLMVAAMAFAIPVGGAIGILAAVRHGSWTDTGLMMVVTAGLSIPSFWLGMLLLLVFAVTLHLVPAIGTEQPISLILPAITLGVGAAAVIARFLRGSLLEVLGQDYIVTARSKGVPERRIISAHALRNAAVPVITVIGLQVGSLLAGAVIMETIFTRPGVGQMLLSGITNRDFAVVQGTVLFTTFVYVMVNLIVDVLYTVVDPRIRHEERQW